MANESRSIECTVATGGFGKSKAKRTPEEDSVLAARTKMLWSVDMEILRNHGPEYWGSWKKAYYKFQIQIGDPKAEAFLPSIPMSANELEHYINENGLTEWTPKDI